MRTFDKGTPVKYKDVKVGDLLIVGNGFTCLAPDTCTLVYEDVGALYVNCDDGRHYLDGQIDWDGKAGVGDGYLVGLRLAP